MARAGRFCLTLGTRVALALVLGLGVGLFFGESVSFLKDIGRAFILLLQMIVLPYITLSLITGLGQSSCSPGGSPSAVILTIPLAFPVGYR